MSKLFSRATVTGTTLAGATLKTSLTTLWDALNSIGITDSTRSTVTASATLATTQAGLVPVDCTSASVTLTLPTSGATTDELEYDIRRVDSSANTLTVQRGGTDTIDGQTGWTIPPGGILKIKMPGGGTNWRITNVSAATPSIQANTAFTTTGSAAAYVLTPTPQISALAANQRFRVKFSFSTTGACTLAVSGTTATALKQFDYTGTKVDPTIVSGQLADVEYDGTNWVILTPLPPTVRTFPAVRQTVLTGPVDTNGLPSFGGSTGSTTVTASGTLVATAANGSDVQGNIDRVGSITNPSWTGLSTNGTMYLYLDIAANGTCTTGSTTSAPVYQWGGTYGVGSGVFTFNIQAMSGQVGNGASAAQTYRVFVGQVTVAAGVVSAITWYALQGRYQSVATAIPIANTRTAFAHNIGMFTPLERFVHLVNVTAEGNYTTGQITTPIYNVTSINSMASPILEDNVTASVMTPAGLTVINRTTGLVQTITFANWNYIVTIKRGW